MAKMTKEEFLNYYWKQYLFLENKVMNLETYIYFCKKNLSVNSYEIMNLLFSVCSELDTLFKIVCDDKSDDIVKYRKSIESKSEYDDIFKERINIIGRDVNLKPFYRICERDYFYWWKGYNKVKHNRVMHFRKANLDKLLNSLAALYTLEVYYYKNNFGTEGFNMPGKSSKLFKTTLLIKKGGILSELEYETVDEWDE